MDENDGGGAARPDGDIDHFALRARILQRTLRCLDDRTVEDLTVSCVCERAQVSRSQFYRLFESKYDVFNWWLRMTMRSSFAQIGTVLPWNRGLVELLRALDVNRRLCTAFLVDNPSDVCRDALTSYAERSLLRSLGRHVPEGDLPPRYRFEARMFAHVLTLAVREWLGEDAPPYALADNLMAVVPPDLLELLGVDDEGDPFTNERLRVTDDAAVIGFVAEEVFTSL